MKLKTVCTAHTINGHMDDFSHDAAVAHALVMAMSEVEYESFGRWTDCVHWVNERATKLLAEWGLGEGD